MGSEGFGPEVVFNLPTEGLLGYDIAITQTVTVTWFIMAVLMIFSIMVTRNLKKVPGKSQNVVEMIVDAVYNLVKQTMGEKRVGFAPYMGTILIFLAIANISGLFGLRPPTADVNTTMGLAIMTFFMIHFFGIKYKGTGSYLKGFLDPMPFLLPLNIIGELATPISLGFRLFGNIVGGLIIMQLLYGAMGTLAFIPVPALLHVYFDLFAGILQSFIFTMLTMVFVSMAID